MNYGFPGVNLVESYSGLSFRVCEEGLMLFESPQGRDSHITVVPTKLSRGPEVYVSDAGTF